MNDISIIETAQRPTQPTKLSTLSSYAKTTLTLVVFGTIAATAFKLNQRLEVATSLLSVPFAVGTLLAIVYRLTNPYGWSLVIRGIGHQVDSWNATQVWLIAESRRWLPGGIWGYTSRAVGSQQLGLTKTVASASMAIELIVTIAAAVVVSVIGLIAFQNELTGMAQEMMTTTRLNLKPAYLIGACLSLSGFTAFLLRRTIGRKLRNLIQKTSALRDISIQPVALSKALGYFVLMAALNGMVNTCLLPAIDSQSVPIMAMIAATATAWIIGFFAFFSPGGILVREAALAALLLPWLPYETGFALAILSRFAQLVAEVTGMAIAIYIRRTSTTQA